MTNFKCKPYQNTILKSIMTIKDSFLEKIMKYSKNKKIEKTIPKGWVWLMLVQKCLGSLV